MKTALTASFPPYFHWLLGLLRRQNQSPKQPEELRQEALPDVLQASGQLVDPGPALDPKVENQLDPGEIVQLLESISRETRDIYLAYRAGYTYDDIANLTGLAHTTIRRHIARALLAIMEYQAPGKR